MEPTKPVRVVLLILGMMLAGCWALLIWIATIVTDTMLRVLSYIVEMAGMN